MGLLSRTWNAIEPTLERGLLGGYAPQAPQAPQGPTSPFEAPRPSGWQRIGAALQDAGTAYRGGDPQASAALRQTGQVNAIHRLIDETVADPRERLVAHLNPGEWAKENASRYGSRVITPGAVLNVAGQNVAGAPVIHAFDDRNGYTDPLHPELGTQYSAPRGPTYQEQTQRQTAAQTAENARAMQEYRALQIQLEKQRLGETGRHNRAAEGTAAQRERRMGAGGAGAGSVSVGGSSDPMAAIEAELRRRGKIK